MDMFNRCFPRKRNKRCLIDAAECQLTKRSQRNSCIKYILRLNMRAGRLRKHRVKELGNSVFKKMGQELRIRRPKWKNFERSTGG